MKRWLLAILHAAACIILSINAAAGAAEGEGAEPGKAPAAEDVLQGKDYEKAKSWLQDQWKPWAENPAFRTATNRERLIGHPRKAVAHEEPEIRALALRFLSIMGAKEYAAQAIAEYRASMYSSDTARQAQLAQVVLQFARLTDAPLADEFALTDNYRTAILSMMAVTGQLKSLPPAALSRLVEENMDAAERFGYSIAQAALLALAETGDARSPDLIRKAQASEPKVSIKGQTEFYPIRHTAAIASRIYGVTGAKDKTEAMAKALKQLEPAKDEDRLFLSWALEYVSSQKMRGAVQALKDCAEGNRFGEDMTKRIEQTIGVLQEPPREEKKGAT